MIAVPAVTAVILAAGESRRMGTQKVLLPYGETTVLGHIIGALKEGGVSDVVVVTGHKPDPVREAAQQAGARVAHNDAYKEGMLSSVRCGLRASDDAEAHLIALGDQPSIRASAVQRVREEFHNRRGKDVIVVPATGGKRGHPLLFSAAFRDEVLNDFDDVGLRGLLQRHPDAIAEAQIDDDGVLRDMDYPEDYQRELTEFDRTQSN